jgi:hypothetical protein
VQARRDLKFNSLSQVMPEVDRLLQGYVRGRNWTLGQVCQHLALSLERTVEGWRGSAPWLVRKTIGPWIGAWILSSGKMPEGSKFRPEWGLEPGSGLDDRAEAEALRGALHYYAGRSDPFPAHPVFGPLSRLKWDRLHCIHCAHHLSFLLPAGLDSGQAEREGV